MANIVKKFPLRIMDKKTYSALEKIAASQYTSINTLINTILEDSLKKDKKSLVISK